MEIRKANLKDADKVAEIVLVLYLDIPDFVWTQKDYIGNQIEKGEYWVAEDEGKALGAMSLREKKGMLYIETLAVAKDIQAKGVGTALVEFAKRFAKENGYKIIMVMSFFEYGVKDFYLKNGFRLLDEPGEYGGHKFYRLETEV